MSELAQEEALSQTSVQRQSMSRLLGLLRPYWLRLTLIILGQMAVVGFIILRPVAIAMVIDHGFAVDEAERHGHFMANHRHCCWASVPSLVVPIYCRFYL